MTTSGKILVVIKMEKPKSQQEVRKEIFDRHAETARHLADESLQDIDRVLKDEEELIETLNVSISYGNLTPEEADQCLAWYHKTRTGHPIDDNDTLASPIGYYEPPKSIYD